MAIPFDYTSEYKRKLRTPEEAARVVKSGDWLDISMGGAFPSLMDEAIAKRKDELRGVKIRGYLIQQPIQMVECDPDREHFIYNSWHMSGYERKLCDRGLCNFNPMVFRNLGAYYDHFLTVNVAITCVTPMNEHGYFNFSVSNASARAVLDKADVVILEVNENLPWVYGGLDECIHIDDVDMIVEGPHGPLPGIKTPAASETEMKIAEYVVQNMVDGSTLQLGIGSLPNAVGQMIARSDLRDLGIHTEMLCDSYLDMYKAGKINNKRKTLDRYKSVFGFAIGSPDLYDWIRENPGVVTYPISYCNDPSIVGKIDNFVSINNCISVDLYGQICAERRHPADQRHRRPAGLPGERRRVQGRQGVHLSHILLYQQGGGDGVPHQPAADSRRYRHRSPESGLLHRHRIRRREPGGLQHLGAGGEAHLHRPPQVPGRADRQRRKAGHLAAVQQAVKGIHT